MSLVGDLLRESWAAHERARQQTIGTDGRRVVIRDSDSLEWKAAFNLRKLAHKQDKGHTDPAWTEEQFKTPRGRQTHEELMAFYQSKF